MQIQLLKQLLLVCYPEADPTLLCHQMQIQSLKQLLLVCYLVPNPTRCKSSHSSNCYWSVTQCQTPPDTNPVTQAIVIGLLPSARPHTAVPPDEKVTTPYRQVQSPLTTREVIGITHDDVDSSDRNGNNEALKLVFHDSDFTVSQIIDNPKVGGVWLLLDE